MKKIVFFILCATIGCTQISMAQNYITPFKKGQIDLNAGVGLLPILDFNPSITLDVAVSDNFSVGVMAAYGGASKLEEPSSSIIKDYSLGFRMAMHYTMLKYWDYYGGIMTGYKFNTGDANQIKQYKNLFLLTCILGTRFHFNNHIGVFGEFSFNGHSFISMGVNIRI